MKGSRKLSTAVLAAAAVSTVVVTAPVAAAAAEPYEVVASGLDNPRHLQFDSAGVLYVAESGRGGDQACAQAPEGGEACYGGTGAITAVHDGEQQRVVTGLPSFAGADGSAASGPSDVAPTPDGNLLVTLGYGGDPAARAALPAEFSDVGWLVRADPDGGGTERFADIAGFEGSANPDGSVPPDSNPNAVLARGAGAVVVDAGGNSLVGVAEDGAVELIATFPTRPQVVGVPIPDGPPVGTEIPSESVPTSVTAHDGELFVGELTGFPFAQGGAQVYRVDDGEPVVRAGGFTTVIEVETDDDGTLYVLELATAGLLATAPGELPAGRLLKLAPGSDVAEVVAENLPAPGGVAVYDGRAYVSVNSVLPGAGEVIAIPL